MLAHPLIFFLYKGTKFQFVPPEDGTHLIVQLQTKAITLAHSKEKKHSSAQLSERHTQE